VLLSVSSSQATSSEVAASSGQRQRQGACWAGPGDAIGKRFWDRTVGVDAAPEFMQKRNSEPIFNRGRIAEDARLEIGEPEVRGRARVETRFRSRAGIRPTTSVLVVSSRGGPDPPLWTSRSCLLRGSGAGATAVSMDRFVRAVVRRSR
jgi:hypothetical protein